MRFGQVFARDPLDDEAAIERLRALLADGFAFARGKRGQKIVERGIPLVVPVELLVSSLQQVGGTGMRPFRFGEERDVQRGCAELACQFDAGREQQFLALGSQRTRRHQQAVARHGCERHGAL